MKVFHVEQHYRKRRADDLRLKRHRPAARNARRGPREPGEIRHGFVVLREVRPVRRPKAQPQQATGIRNLNCTPAELRIRLELENDAANLLARRKDLGNFEVGRVLPFHAHRMVGPFTFLDHMGPAAFDPGFAKSAAEKNTAESIARGVNGVKSIKNEIAIRP